MSLTDAKPDLIEDLLQAFYFESTSVDDPADSRVRLATKMANAIDKFIRAGKVEVDPGIDVSTTGHATAQTGQTTEKGIGKVI